MRAVFPVFFKNMNGNMKKGLTLIALLSAALAVKSAYGYHMQAKERIFAAAEELMALQTAAARSTEIKMLIKKNEEKLLELEKGILNKGTPAIGAAELQEAFKGYTAKRGIVITSEKPLPHIEDGVYMKVPVEFQFKAALPQFKELMNEIQASPVALGVRSIRLKSNGRQSAGSLDVSLVVEGAMRK